MVPAGQRLVRHGQAQDGERRHFQDAVLRHRDNPWYVKAGSVLPLAEEGIQNLQGQQEGLRLLIVPGKGLSRYSLYEDDGISQAYEKDFSRTLITKEATSRGLRIIVGPREGTFAGALPSRKLTLLLEGWTELPSQVLLDGRPLEIAASASEGPATPAPDSIVAASVTEHAVTLTLPATSANLLTVIDIRN